MDGFCDTPFWDTELLWEGSWPQFTQCFQDTVLIWTPCGFLWLASIFYVYALLSWYRTQPIPISTLYITKLVLSGLLFMATIAQFLVSVSDHLKQETSLVEADVFAHVVLALTVLLSCWLVVLERRRAFITSGVLFIFWLLLLVSQIVPFYSLIKVQEYEESVGKFILFYVQYAVILAQFLVHCLAEKTPHMIFPVKAPCPETEASFLSRLTFWWCNGLLLQAYRSPLTEELMTDLNPREKSCNVVSKFLANWSKEVARARALLQIKLYKQGRRSSFYDLDSASVHPPDEITPLVINADSKRTENSSGKPPRLQSSLLKILCKTFGWELLLTWVWKLFYDFLILTNPLVLGQLILFVEDENSPDWKGYLFAVAMFSSMQLQSFFFHQLWHHSTSLGLRVRTCLISAVYRKALTMNNQARRESTVGEVVNLMSVDAEQVEGMMGYMWAIWSSPLQICVSLYLLYATLGPSMFAGLGLLLLLIPINGLVMTKMGNAMTKMMSEKDHRMKVINEVLSGMKILKLYAWEPSFAKKISDVRDQELRVLFKYQVWCAGMTFSWTVAPYAVSLVTFLVYIYIVEDHYLRPETAFVAISLFNVLRFAINFAPMVLTEIIKAVISIRRINRFLNHVDLDPDNIIQSADDSGDAISVLNGTFMWNPEIGPTLKNITIRIPEGSLVAVVGQVGSGKSSLMSAIIGDMEKVTGEVRVKGSLAYVPQQAWIQNNTVRSNILFGDALKQDMFDTCIKACALDPDLAILPDGDLTEIGERGINLSGGQKQRVSLARAVYSNSDVYLLDDPLSAVDSHVGKHIFEEVIGQNGLLKRKTRILVTHGVHWLPMVDQVIVMKGGCVSEVGSYEELLSHNGPFAQFLKTYLLQEDHDTSVDPEVAELRRQVLQRLESISGEDLVDVEAAKLEMQKSVSSDGKSDMKDGEAQKTTEKPTDLTKLIEEEKVETGHVRFAVFKEYAHALGYGFALLVVIIYAVFEGGSVLANIWLSKWTDDPDLKNMTVFPANSSERMERNNYYLSFYGGFGAVQAFCVIIYSVVQSVRTVHASRVLHNKMLSQIMRAPMSFFDTTPIGRIVNRFSQDINTIDSELPLTFVMCLDSFLIVMTTLIVVSYSTPYFLIAVLPLLALYLLVQRFYIPTSRQLKRLASKTRSPIYNHFSETVSGASVIRAYGRQSAFIEESERRVDTNQMFGFYSYSANRWLGFRLEFLGNIVVLVASAVAAALKHTISGGIVGLSVSYALEITTNLSWLVRMISDLETQVVSVERVKEYTEIATEAAWQRPGYRPPLAWPQNGQVKVQNLCLRYRSGLDLVLKDISVSIRSGEKVGLVGRTGAGKSSFTLALFRLIEPAAGEIRVDDVNVAQLGLHDLRSRLTILPQDPVIFAGSLRMNLDPFSEYSDAQVWMALEHAHLRSFIDSLPEKLEHECGEGGENLSVGQRQLLCLARSLLRKTKILILDEATAAVDMETDELIQQTIRTEFADSTVLTIAHRLNTVMDYDRILVLDKGQVAAFDSPENLLKDRDGIFFQMAKSAGIAS